MDMIKTRVTLQQRQTINNISRIKSAGRNYKLIKGDVQKLKVALPRRRQTGLSHTASNEVFKTFRESDNLTLEGISEARQRASQIKQVVNAAVKPVVKTGKVIKKSYSLIRTKNKRFKTAPGATAYKIGTGRNGIFSKAKNAALSKVEVDKNSTNDSMVAAAQTARDASNKLKPVKKVTDLFTKPVSRPTSKLDYAKSKNLLIDSVKKKQLNRLKGLRSQRNVIRNTSNLVIRKKSASKVMKGTKNAIRTSKRAAKAAKVTFKVTVKAARAVSAALKSLLSNPVALKAIAIIAAVVLLIILINSVISLSSAPLYIFMADSDTALKYKEEITKLDKSFKAKISALSALNFKELDKLAADDLLNNPNDKEFKNIVDSIRGKRFDSVVVDYKNEAGGFKPNWKEILCIIAVLKEQDLLFSDDEKKVLVGLSHEFNKIETSTETYKVSCGTNSKGETMYENKTRLKICVYTYGLGDTIYSLALNQEQKEWVYRLINSDISDVFPGCNIEDEIYSTTQRQELIQKAPGYNVTREDIIRTATSLVGRVPYFWGGKSSAGWNKLWGTKQLVVAQGSITTGTYQPYGLDCSGFVDWVYETAGAGYSLSGGTTSQWDASYPVGEGDLQPGDLAFKQTPHTSGVNHVGIYIGTDSNSNKKFVHCESGEGVVVNDYTGFKYFRRPFVNLKGG